MKIFLSAPISAFRDDAKYSEYRQSILSLITFLRKQNDVYSEIEHITGLNGYDEPGKSAVEDFRRISESDVFMLHHPARMQTSALVELGYAIAKEKIIVIIAFPQDLPYLALGLSSYHATVSIIPNPQLSQEIYEQISSVLENSEAKRALP